MAATGNAVVLFTAEPDTECSVIGCTEAATATVSLPVADERPLILPTCRAHGIAAALDWSES